MKLPDELMFLTNKNATQHACALPMKDKICVITGATSGVGLEALRALAKGQASIIMVARNRRKAEEVKQELIEKYNTSVDIMIADFSRLEDVRGAAK